MFIFIQITSNGRTSDPRRPFTTPSYYSLFIIFDTIFRALYKAPRLLYLTKSAISLKITFIILFSARVYATYHLWGRKGSKKGETSVLGTGSIIVAENGETPEKRRTIFITRAGTHAWDGIMERHHYATFPPRIKGRGFKEGREGRRDTHRDFLIDTFHSRRRRT